MIYVITTL